MSTRTLGRLNFSSSKSCRHRIPRIALRYYCDSVTVIFSNAPMFVTCSCETDCHSESPASRVQCGKMAKIHPVSPFYLTLRLEKATLQWGNLQEVRKMSKYLLLCVSELEVFLNTQLPRGYRNFLQYKTQANSQVCFK